MKTRIFWLDVIKFLAICFVVLAHVIWAVELSVDNGLSHEYLTINRIFGSLGVPLFMMVSGVLLFDKPFKSKDDVLLFYRKGLLPLLITAWIWIALYCILQLNPFSFKELLSCMTLVHKPEVHLWYVRLILLYYLAIPFIYLLRSKWKIAFGVLLILIAGFTFIYNGWLIYRCDLCPTSFSRSYFCYLIYMSMGYGLTRVSISRTSISLVSIVAVLGGHVLYKSLMASSYFLWYDNPMIAIIAFCLFYLLRAFFSKSKSNSCIVELSKMTYGIYLSHFILIYVACYFMKNVSWSIVIFYLTWMTVLLVDVLWLWLVKRCSCKVSKVIHRY